MKTKKVLALAALVGSPLVLALATGVLPKVFVILFGIIGVLNAGLIALLLVSLLLPIDFTTLLL